MLIGSAMSLVGAGASYLMTPKSSNMDTTNYEMLAETQRQANEESDAAQARIEEARKREELRQQSLQYSDVLTSDSGDDSNLNKTTGVLGKGK